MTHRQSEASRCRSDAPPALTVAQAAARLQVSEATLYRLLRLGLFPGCRVGAAWRIDPARLDALFAAPAPHPNERTPTR